MAIPIIKIKCLWDCLTLIMGISILVRHCFHIETPNPIPNPTPSTKKKKKKITNDNFIYLEITYLNTNINMERKSFESPKMENCHDANFVIIGGAPQLIVSTTFGAANEDTVGISTILDVLVMMLWAFSFDALSVVILREFYPSLSISLLLMIWWHKEPEHQHPWYWSSPPGIF